MRKNILLSCLLVITLMIGCLNSIDTENVATNENTGIVVSKEKLKQRTVLKEKADKLLELFGERKVLTVEEIEGVIYESGIDDGLIEKLDVEEYITYQAGGDVISALKGIENEITAISYSYEGSSIKLGYDSRLEVPVYTVERVYNNSKEQVDSLAYFEKSEIERAYLNVVHGYYNGLKIDEVESMTDYVYPEESIMTFKRDIETIDGIVKKDVTVYSRIEDNEGLSIEVIDGAITSIHYSNAPEDVNDIKEIKSHSCVVNEDGTIIFTTKISILTREAQTEVLNKLQHVK